MVVLVTLLLPRLRHPFPTIFPDDFNVYYTTALLVRQGEAAQIYTGADTGADPQKAVAAPDTPLARAARGQGLAYVGLYVYPPLLADLLFPLTFVHLGTAAHLWFFVNGAFLLLTTLCLLGLLKIPVVSWKAALILLASLCFTPALQGVADGQITIFLLLLWAAGTLLYQRGHPVAAGAVFALATAIKLTPALVLVPFLLWRRWRFVGGFLIALLGLALLCVVVDTPHAFGTYFTRVMPAMSGAIPYFTNMSLPAAVERLSMLVRAGSVPPFPAVLPRFASVLGKLASVCILGALTALLVRMGTVERRSETYVLGLLSLLAPILSPVSWFHAYATGFLAFALLWREALEHEPGWGYLGCLTAVSLLLGSAVSEKLAPALAFSGHPDALAWLQLSQLLAAAAIVLYEVSRCGPAGPRHLHCDSSRATHSAQTAP